MGMRKYFKTILRTMKHWLEEDGTQSTSIDIPSVPFDNSYEWLYFSFSKLMLDPACAKRPQYIWGVLQGAALAKVLSMQRISVIEFGVGGGAGLLALERSAEHCEKIADIGIDIYGFDTGTGLPKPHDYRDCPYKWSEGYYPADKAQFAKRLRRAHLRMGLLQDTVPAFIDSSPSPIAFVAIDLCLYSSTIEALSLFDASHGFLLPRIPCSFRSAVGKDFSDYSGELLAISEFNSMHVMKKLSPIRGLRDFVPREFSWFWTDMLHTLHIFDHPLYGCPEALRQSAIIDIDDNQFFKQVSRD